MWSTATFGCGASDCWLVSCFGLEDHAMENVFDLLMENASHSDGIYGDTNLRSRWGTTALAANRSQKAQYLGLDSLAFGPLVVAEVRTE
jgi:hypothetical protein